MSPTPTEPLRICVLGLGYVGLPLALALGRLHPTVGYDIDAARVAELQRGHDRSGECSADELAGARLLRYSAEAADLAGHTVYIIAVPTPVDARKLPDLSPLLAASRAVAPHLRAGAIVIYESTVYPGATEEICVPVLEQGSGLRVGHDLGVGYSPERINPGDRRRRLADIVKVTSGSDAHTARQVDALYASIIPAGTHLAPSIRVAEAAKAIENTQRDVNIALMNELAQLFARLHLDTEAVLAAAATKWNFLPFRPGLVGGHCIGVDPYYLVHKAHEVGFHPDLILAARRTNESMGEYVASEMLRLMARRGVHVVGARVLVLGLTFKENCADLRNTRVVEIIESLRSYRAEVEVYDPWADPAQALAETGVSLCAEPAAGVYDGVVIAVAHQQFRDWGSARIRACCRPGGVVYDVKYVLPAADADARL